jgi:YVTN family beta-propeller protein
VTDKIPLAYGDLYNRLAISPDGCYVYVTNQGLNTITVVSTLTKTVIKTFTYPTEYEPYGVAVSPDGRTVYVANAYVGGAAGTGTLSVISV